jgi:WD40 repeat protein
MSIRNEPIHILKLPPRLVAVLSLLVLLAVNVNAQSVPISAHKAQPLSCLVGTGGELVCFSPDGSLIATSGGGDARVWDAKTFRPVIPAIKHDSMVQAMEFLGHQRLLTASDDEVAVWDTITGKAIGKPLVIEPGVFHVAVSSDGRRAAGEAFFGFDDAVFDVVVYGVASGKKLLSARHDGRRGFTALNRDGSRMLVMEEFGFRERKFRLWNIDQGEEQRPAIDSDCKMDSYAELGEVPAAFSADGSRAAIAHLTWFEIYDARSGERLADNRKVDGPPGSPILRGVTFSHDSRIAVTVGEGSVRSWDAATGKPVASPLICDLYAFAVSPDGRRIAGTFSPRPVDPRLGAYAVGLWDLTAGKQLATLDVGGHGSRTIAFSPDGKLLATGTSGSFDTLLWDANSLSPQPTSQRTR